MDRKINELLTEKILRRLPSNLKPVEYLVDTLDIGRESAYRRMRGEIPFSFSEIAELSLRLDFSVDEIIGKNEKKRISFDLQAGFSPNLEENFLLMFKEYDKIVESFCEAKDVEVLISVNRFKPLFIIEFDALFKFYYYKWMHQAAKTSINCTYSDIVIPDELLYLQKKIKSRINLIDNVTFIIDRNLFYNVAREIQYYYNRKLISEEDVLLIKQEMIAYLKYMEGLIQKGENEAGSTYNFYLSLLDIDSNTIYAKHADSLMSQCWIYAVNPIIITNPRICEMHKKWLESLKKYSVLITQSNEILQAVFLNKQREYVENITNDLLYYG
jgi:hypothetical protein